MKKTHVVSTERSAKAKKIEHFVLKRNFKLKILSVGVGSGLIEKYFVERGYDVTGVDVVDSRIFKGFPFCKIKNEILPFRSNTFDVVISNHVIEHTNNQELHLAEIARVKKKNGLLYLATPNKYSLIEPHYHILFLSWYPIYISNLILRFLKLNDVYDVKELSKFELESLLNKCFISYKSLTRDIFNLEMKRILKSNPTLLYILFKTYPFFEINIPSLIYVVH